MSAFYDQQVEGLLAEYEKQRQQAIDTRQRINELTGTATAPRQTVKVTVSAQGEIQTIEFPTGAYRRMAPKELADALTDTINAARAKALEQVAELMSAQLPEGVNFADLLQGRVDPTVLLPDTPEMPDGVRDFLEHGRMDGPGR
jgi:DNA-binding protein YbaB